MAYLNPYEVDICREAIDMIVNAKTIDDLVDAAYNARIALERFMNTSKPIRSHALWVNDDLEDAFEKNGIEFTRENCERFWFEHERCFQDRCTELGFEVLDILAGEWEYKMERDD